MPNYRRFYAGNVWFFTVATQTRKPLLTSLGARFCLRMAIGNCRERYPFQIEGWVLLPDHLHCIWHLPDSDLDYSRRWSLIKRKFTQQFRQTSNFMPPFWQKRFWAHAIFDERDYASHLDYTHYNPVKHGYVKAPGEWPWTSFHRSVALGLYPSNWGENVSFYDDIGNE